MEKPLKNTPPHGAPAIKVALDEAGAREPAEKKTAPEFTVLEAGLPEELGVSREIIRAIRQHQLTENVDWVKRHKDIWLTGGGVEKIGRALALISGTGEGVSPGAAAAEKATTLQGQAEACTTNESVKVEVFRVLRSGFKNRSMVKVFDPKEPTRIVWVRVKDNSKWVVGMELEATHVQHDQYVLHGNNPRWRGKL